MTTHTLDASHKSIGRIATQAAVLLMGKNKVDFARNAIPETRVLIEHAGLAKFTGNKMAVKTYSRYSGYPGGLKQPTAARVAEKKGYSELVREAVAGMLPKNKLRARMLKNLTVTE